MCKQEFGFIGLEEAKDPDFEKRVVEIASSGRDLPTSSLIRFLVAFLEGDDPLPLQAAEIATRLMQLTPLFPRSALRVFQDIDHGKVHLQKLIKMGIRAILIDGVDYGKVSIASKGLDATIIHGAAQQHFVTAHKLDPSRAWGGLLAVALGL